MSELLFIAVIVLGVLLADTRRRLARLERQILSPARGDRPASGTGEPAAASPRPAREPVRPPEPALPALAREQATAAAAKPPERTRARRRVNFEDLAGKQLPIWVGGVALACAAFFLVRYSIELGLFGPRTRSLLAALFGLILLALAELGPRLPVVGRSFAEDGRLPQALAGAGIATLYATLYMAAELYGLIGIAAGFVLVLAITAAALYLSLRHGPPTALIGLAGGYIAPFLAGLPDSSVSATAVYLATFTFGLFALALHRRWSWLAWCASAASLVWTVSLLAIAEANERVIVAALVLGIAVAAAAVLSAARQEGGKPFRQLAPVLPLVAGMLQLAGFTAMADFTPLSWAFYLAISAATIVLARHQPRMQSAVWGALGIAAVTVAGSFAGGSPSVAAFVPPLAFAALFGGAGQWFAFGPRDGRRWAWLGAMAPALMLAASGWFVADQGVAAAWGAACIAAALPAGVIVRRADRRSDRESADVGVAVTMAAMLAAAGFLVPGSFQPLAWAGIAIGLAWWRMRHGRLHAATGLVILALVALAMLREANGLAEVPWRALAGEQFHFQHIPSMAALFTALALPGGMLLVAELRGLSLRTGRAAAGVLGALAIGGFVYALAKQPLGIADPQAFVRWGFIERAIISQALFAGGWLLLRRAVWRSPQLVLGAALLAVALFRFIWFDLLVLNPLLVRQALVGVPLVNAGALHGAAVAAWLWPLARRTMDWPPTRRAALPLQLAAFATTIATVLVAVRQAVHGAIVAAAPVTRTENYFYSAALLLLAVAWLAFGIRQKQALIRVAGLALLTAVTIKVFLVDAAALAGLLRVLSFLGLGAALIGIGWAYGRVGPAAPTKAPVAAG